MHGLELDQVRAVLAVLGGNDLVQRFRSSVAYDTVEQFELSAGAPSTNSLTKNPSAETSSGEAAVMVPAPLLITEGDRDTLAARVQGLAVYVPEAAPEGDGFTVPVHDKDGER